MTGQNDAIEHQENLELIFLFCEMTWSIESRFSAIFGPQNRRVENPKSLFHLLSDFESKRTKLTFLLSHPLVPTFQNSP